MTTAALHVDPALAESARLASENARLRAQLDAALEEIAVLRREIAAQRREMATMRHDADTRAAELTAEIARLADLVAKGNDRIAELLAIAKRKNRKEKPPKPPQPPRAVDPAAAAAFAKRPVPPEPPPPEERKKKPPRPTGRHPLPAHLPAVESTLVPKCSCCGGDAPIVDEVVEEKLTVEVKAHQRRITRRKTVYCVKCGVRTTAEAPPAPFERSAITCEWLAWFAAQKYQLLVPPDRIRRYLGAQGLAIAQSTLVSWDDRAGELLDTIDGEHWKELRRGPWMQADATGLKVIVKGLDKSHNGYLEVFKRDAIVVFQYTPEKSGDTFAAKFVGFEGILLTDAEHRHNRVYDNPKILEAGCNAHFRRKLRDAEAVQPVLAFEAGKFVSAIYDIEEIARKQGLTDEALRTARQACRPVYDDLAKWIAAVEPTLVPSDPLAGAIRYFTNHRAALTRFIDHPEIPIDNSASEREYQPIAKLRLNMLFAGGTDAAHRDAVLLGIAATCRNLGVDLTAYLVWAFERRGTARERFGNLPASALTPAAYLRAVDTS